MQSAFFRFKPSRVIRTMLRMMGTDGDDSAARETEEIDSLGIYPAMTSSCILEPPPDGWKESIDWPEVFGRIAPLHLEIGPGKGLLLATQAERYPQWDFVGIEMRRPRVEKCAGKVTERGLTNVRLLEGPVETLLDTVFSAGSLGGVFVNFPDPWPKRRHHPRRLIQPQFLDCLSRLLSPGGVFRVATDHHEYALWIHEHMEKHDRFENQIEGLGYRTQGDEWSGTIHEKKFLAWGRSIRYFHYHRIEIEEGQTLGL
ncbi:MAG: tRNA (guanosine(46)-N7)-methyltransferase TrmB [Planctomycetota bacterium]|jgi:tRNA (guanine-N7-)-methyltransferase|nr:tRNA (guanosine(46)-N7)-methyltransferase TrmB [Planctomycetota bacterium]